MTKEKLVNEVKEQAKALPFKYDAGWTAVPNAIFEIYPFHPKFTAACTNIYLFLLHRHNAKYGYAFPTQDQIADALCISRSTVNTSIRTLKSLGLIDVERHPDHDNVVYFMKRPIDNILTFELKFPEAKANRLKHEASRESDKQKRHDRQSQFREKQAAAKAGIL